MGQPTHVFDLDKLSGGIVVRLARAGEKLHLLDGTERTLTADDLVVADEKQVHGLAGVMGGWDSRVTEATKNILVEAAWFDPAAVRASSRRHGLHTDASHRFERGADFNAAPARQPPRHAAGRRAVRRRGRRPAHRRHRPRARRPHRQPPGHHAAHQRDQAPPRRHARRQRDRREARRAVPQRARLHAHRIRHRPVQACNFRAGGSTSSARSTSSKRSPASTATTSSPTRCPASPAPSWSCRTPRRSAPSARRCSRSATARPSPAPSCLQKKRQPSAPHPPSPWATRSARRPACCAPRSLPAWRPCSRKICIATSTPCASSNSAPSSPAPPLRCMRRPASRSAPPALPPPRRCTQRRTRSSTR